MKQNASTELSKSNEEKLQGHLERIYKARASYNDSVIAIGRELAAIQETIGHGKFLPYVAEHCGFSKSTAYNYLAAFEQFGAFKRIEAFDSEAILTLSKCKPAATKAKELANAGYRINLRKAKNLVSNVKDTGKRQTSTSSGNLSESHSENSNPSVASSKSSNRAALYIDTDKAEEEDLEEANRTPQEVCDDHNKAVEALCRLLKKTLDDANLPWLQTGGLIDSAKGHLRGCVETLRGAKSAVCPACEGLTCDKCGGFGFLPTGMAAQLGRVK